MLLLEIAAQGVKGVAPAGGRITLRPGYNVVEADGLALRRLIEALTVGAARVFGLPGGTLAKGAPADVAVLDPALEWTYDPAAGFSKSQNSPWKSKRLVGRCTHAFVGAKLVHGEK